MIMINGTANFPSIQHAKKHYGMYEGEPLPIVMQKIEEGLIVIGQPDLKEGETLVMLDRGTRYGIKTKGA
jgi:hypothetical protein